MNALEQAVLAQIQANSNMQAILELFALQQLAARPLQKPLCNVDVHSGVIKSSGNCNTAATKGHENCCHANCELRKPEYQTDDFMMYVFKVKMCERTDTHDWTCCPFRHPGEKASRRDVRVHKYYGESCPDFRKGTCKRGDLCPYAHGVYERWLHPSNFRTQLCTNGANCNRSTCFFAHYIEQLRTADPGPQPLSVLIESPTNNSDSSSSGTLTPPLSATAAAAAGLLLPSHRQQSLMSVPSITSRSALGSNTLSSLSGSLDSLATSMELLAGAPSVEGPLVGALGPAVPTLSGFQPSVLPPLFHNHNIVCGYSHLLQ